MHQTKINRALKKSALGRWQRSASAPSPAEIRAARKAAGLTQAQAAALVSADHVTWQRWEMDRSTASARRMSAAAWELFRLKLK